MIKLFCMLMTDYRGWRISRPAAKPEHRPCGNDSFDLPALPKNRFLWVGVRPNYGDVYESVVIQIQERARCTIPVWMESVMAIWEKEILNC